MVKPDIKHMQFSFFPLAAGSTNRFSKLIKYVDFGKDGATPGAGSVGMRENGTLHTFTAQNEHGPEPRWSFWQATSAPRSHFVPTDVILPHLQTFCNEKLHSEQCYGKQRIAWERTSQQWSHPVDDPDLPHDTTKPHTAHTAHVMQSIWNAHTSSMNSLYPNRSPGLQLSTEIGLQAYSWALESVSRLKAEHWKVNLISAKPKRLSPLWRNGTRGSVQA